MGSPRLFLSAPLSTPVEQTRNAEWASLLEAHFEVYLPQRDGGLLVELVNLGLTWEEAGAHVVTRDIEALRRSDVVLAFLDTDLVGAGVAFEIGFAHALEIPCFAARLTPTPPRSRSPLIASTLDAVFHSRDEILEWAHHWNMSPHKKM